MLKKIDNSMEIIFGLKSHNQIELNTHFFSVFWFFDICVYRLFQTPQILSSEDYRSFWVTGEINSDGYMEIKVTRS